MARNYRINQALETPNRGIWIATAAVVLAGVIALIWMASPSERERRQAMERLELGDSASRVVAMLGEAPARCPASALEHLRPSFPPGWPAASVETALQELGSRTRERWVYPLNRRAAAGCAPRDEQSEIGVAPDGTIVWYVAITGKTALRLPEEITPAGREATERVR